MVEYFKDGNKLPGTIKCREFLDELRNCWVLKEDPIQWNQFRYLGKWFICSANRFLFT